jgi:hypothetical protein
MLTRPGLWKGVMQWFNGLSNDALDTSRAHLDDDTAVVATR